ncbi:TetR/AcrR family transcriptional regulator [Thermomonospora umbrina]|uniref:TetR family transcriptional regulator n=1 Tax=Thermomonospora umbrina TaxID=111806 RepID=A0A3D9SR55_9ACTN|nr:TetR/AcrR family transcriptional regulator [Thermomonospora umbrina]REE98419.1 TetR family transcriptional regulator [Thermomonospora umbrina]
MAAADPVNQRRYRGMDGPERVAARRASLLEAGLQLFGTVGYNATTVKDICHHAELGRRYFYESFTDREALLLAIYDTHITRTLTAVAEALGRAAPQIEAQSEAGLTALIHSLGSDPRVTRLVFHEIIRVGTPTTEARYRQVRRDFGEFILDTLTRTLDVPRTKRMRLGATVLVGGVTELMTEWLLVDTPADLDELIDIARTLFDLLYQRFLHELTENDTA